MLNVTIEGVAPLLMHNISLADASNPITKEISKIAKKRPKTEADMAELSRLEFLGGLYTNAESRVVIPAKLLTATIINGAKKLKQGPAAKAGIFLAKASFVLDYDGPNSPEDLWEDKRFVHKEFAKVGMAKILRTRPVFEEWRVTFSLDFLDDVCDESQIIEYITLAGRLVGIGDWRPQHGRFKIVDHG